MKNPAVTRVGKLIERRLIELGRQQAWLALECEVTEMSVSLWKKTGKIGKKHIHRVAELLQVDVKELRQGIEEPPSSTWGMILQYVTHEEAALLTAFRLARTKDDPLATSLFTAALARGKELQPAFTNSSNDAPIPTSLG